MKVMYCSGCEKRRAWIKKWKGIARDRSKELIKSIRPNKDQEKAGGGIRND